MRLELEETGEEVPRDDVRDGICVAVFVDYFRGSFDALWCGRRRHQRSVRHALCERLGGRHGAVTD